MAIKLHKALLFINSTKTLKKIRAKGIRITIKTANFSKTRLVSVKDQIGLCIPFWIQSFRGFLRFRDQSIL